MNTMPVLCLSLSILVGGCKPTQKESKDGEAASEDTTKSEPVIGKSIDAAIARWGVGNLITVSNLQQCTWNYGGYEIQVFANFEKIVRSVDFKSSKSISMGEAQALLEQMTGTIWDYTKKEPLYDGAKTERIEWSDSGDCSAVSWENNLRITNDLLLRGERIKADRDARIGADKAGADRAKKL